MTVPLLLTLPNGLSLSRIFLAAAFFQEGVALRLIAIVLAIVSDVLDGFFARKLKMDSAFGVLLDPIADRLFVAIAAFTLLLEGALLPWQIAAFFMRDLGIAFFGLSLLFKKRRFDFRALITGKAATSIQLIILLALTLQFQVPSFFFLALVVLGPLAFIELFVAGKKTESAKEAKPLSDL